MPRGRARLLPLFFLLLFVSPRGESCLTVPGAVAPDLTPITYVTTIHAGTPSLRDHVMGQGGLVVVPSPVYIDFVLGSALNQPLARQNPIIILEGVTLPSKAFVLPAGRNFDVRTLHVADKDKSFSFEVSGAAAGTERFRVYFKGEGRFEQSANPPEIPALDPGKPAKDVDTKGYYEELAARGIKFGPTFLGLSKARVQGASGAGEIIPHPDVEFTGHAIAPPLLDSAIHSVGTILIVNEPGWPLPAKFVALPTSYRRIYYFAGRAGKADKFYWATNVERVFSGEGNALQVEFNLALKNEKGEPVVVLEGGILTVANLGARE